MKITLTRLLETAKILSTEVGQAIPEFFQYMAEFVEQTVRSLRNGLTFSDNFYGEMKQVSLTHDTAQQIYSTRQVTEVRFVRAIKQDTILIGWGWYYDDQNRLTVKAKFEPTPTGTIDCVINLLF